MQPREPFIQSYKDTNIEYSKIKNIYFPSLITLYKYIHNLMQNTFKPINTTEFLIKIVNELVDIEEFLNSNDKNEKAKMYLRKIKDRYVKALSIINYNHLMLHKHKKDGRTNPFVTYRLELLIAIDHVANERNLTADYNGYESLLNITQKSSEKIKKELNDNIENVINSLNQKFPQLANLNQNQEVIRFSIPRTISRPPDDFSNILPLDEDDDDDDDLHIDPIRSSGGGGRVVQQIGSRPNYLPLSEQLLSRISARREQISVSPTGSSEEPIDPPNVIRRESSTGSTSSDDSGFFQTEEGYVNPMDPVNHPDYQKLVGQQEEKTGELHPDSIQAIEKYRKAADEEIRQRVEGTDEQKKKIQEQDERNQRYFAAQQQAKSQAQAPSFLQQAPSQAIVPTKIAGPSQATAGPPQATEQRITQEEVDRQNREAARMVAAMSQVEDTGDFASL